MQLSQYRRHAIGLLSAACALALFLSSEADFYKKATFATFPFPLFLPKVSSVGVAPTVVNTGTTGSTGTQTFNVNLPASLVSGNLIILFIARGGSATQTFSASGWTELVNMRGSISTLVSCGCLYKVSNGSEGATVSVTASATAGAQALGVSSVQVNGQNATTPMEAISTSATGSATNPNAPSFAPALGNKAYLWFAVATQNGNSSTMSAYPTNYTSANALTTNSTARTMTAARALTATTEDPPNFTLTTPGSGSWFAKTCVVNPA